MTANNPSKYYPLSGGQFEPVSTGQFEPAKGGQLKPVAGGQLKPDFALIAIITRKIPLPCIKNLYPLPSPLIIL